MSVIHVSDKNFAKQVLASNKPVLVDFWAEWCAPCKAIAPMLEEIAEEHGDNLVIAKMNIDENPNTPQEYKIRGNTNTTTIQRRQANRHQRRSASPTHPRLLAGRKPLTPKTKR